MPPWDKYKQQPQTVQTPASPQQPAKPWEKHRQQSAPQYRTTENFRRVLQSGGIEGENFERLARTGITPGTAPEFAAAHIQMRQREREEEGGERLSTGEREAIADLYKNLSGREDAGDQDFFAQQQERQRQTRGDTLFGRAQNFGLNVISGLAKAPTSALGVVAPKTAAGLREQQQAAYNPGGGASGFAGQVMAEGANVAGSLALGPYGMAALYGARGAGGARTDIAQLRQEGEDISGLQEAGSAAAIGAVEGASGLIGYRLFRGIGSAMENTGVEMAKRGGIRSVIGQGTRAAGLTGAEAVEEAATELAVNKIVQLGYDPERAITEGVAEAFAMGGILAPIGGAVASRAQGGPITNRADEALHNRIRSRMERQIQGEEEVSPDFQQEESITDPRRLLEPPPTLEEQTERIDREAAEQRTQAERQPESGQRIIVDDQGRAMSEEQATALNEAGVQFVRRIEQQAKTQPKALPAPTRFAAGPQKQPTRQLTSDEVVDFITEISPKEDATDPAEAQAERDYFRGVVQNLENADGPFVEVEIPVNQVDTINTPDPATVTEYAQQPGAESPPIVAGRLPGDLRVTAIDGKHRVAAAKERGDTSIRALVPEADARRSGLLEESTEGVRDLRADEDIAGDQRPLDELLWRELRQEAKRLGVKVGGRTKETVIRNVRRAQKAEGQQQVEQRDQPVPQQPALPDLVRPPAPRLAGEPNAEQQRRAHLKAVEKRRRGAVEKARAEEAQRAAQAVAAAYKNRTGLGTREPGKVSQVKAETAQRIAQNYENMEHAPDDPQVAESYDAFKQETLDQFEALKAAGFTFDLADVDSVAAMYPNAAAIAQDVGQNKHLTTNADPGDMPADHPLAATAPGTDGWTYNQVFRAVHDIFGHAQAGNELDILGEENAWRSHAAMYSEKARGALATETRAQSNWVGYGPYGPQNQQKIKENKIGEVEFPPQKAGLLPDTFWSVPGMTPRPEQQQRPAVSVIDGRQARKAGRQATKKIMGSKTMAKAVDTLDDIIASLAPRIREIDPATFLRVKKLMFNMGVREERFIKAVDDAMASIYQDVGNWNTDLGRRVAAALQTNREDAKALVSEESATAIDDAGQLFDSLQQQARDAGIEVGDIEGFWPRVVTDIDGLWAYLGESDKGEIDRALAAARNARGQALTHEEKVAVINQVFRGRGPVDPGKIGPRHTRQRTLEAVTEEMLPFYQHPTKAAHSYIRDMSKAIERAKFFGRGEVKADNVDDSVGQYLADRVARGELDASQQEQLQKLIRALFVGDMARSGGATRFLKQLAYFSYLTNVKSAITQLADAAANVYLNGPTATIRGYGDALRRKGNPRRVSMEDLGLHDYGAEWDDVGKMAGHLDIQLRSHGFKRFDRLGKEAFINATKHLIRDAANNPRGKSARDLRERYDDIFTEEEWGQLFHDARQGKVTEQFRFLAFIHLANIQPVDVSETPVGYANNSSIFGNTAIQSRLLYTLKTFVFKRMDFIRREVQNDIRNGNKRRAAKRLGGLWLLWTAFELPIDLFKDFLRGKLRWRDLPDTAVDAMLSVVMLNRYMIDEVGEDPVGATANFFTGAIGGGVLEDLISDITQTTTGESPQGYTATPGIRMIRHLPWLGDSLFYLSPIGEGYHITNAQDEKAAKENMNRVRREAGDALRRGDNFQAHVLLNMFNDNKHITGRKTNLTQRELRRAMNREQDNPLDQGGF